MLKFKRGKITEVNYSETDNKVLQKITILTHENDGIMMYHANWSINSDSDLFGVGDIVSFLVNRGTVRSLRLNPFFVD